ncbi:MAG TPA: hypothetical protein VH012_03875 [Acidimicrobiales bacterium]|nr:hypothetical protein [Acidimicrobiales bacterium]
MLPGNDANPDGYWESASLTGFNDAVLARWGGSWWRAPASVTNALLASVSDRKEEAAAAFLETFGADDGWVWKDPRLTVLLPFWLSVLGEQPILFPYRDPQSVAHSIAARDGVSYTQGLAIWEVHTRLALRAMEGQRVLFASYGSLRNDPAGWGSALHAFCQGSGLPVHDSGPVPPDWIATPRSSGEGSTSPQQDALFEFLQACDGPHDSLSLGALPPETDGLRAELASVRPPAWSRLHDAPR